MFKSTVLVNAMSTTVAYQYHINIILFFNFHILIYRFYPLIFIFLKVLHFKV